MTCPECQGQVVKGQCRACGWRETPTWVTESPTRRCSQCQKQRPVEILADRTTFPCPHCGAISAWLCWRCGDRNPVGITVIDGERLYATCRFGHLPRGARAEDRCSECERTVGEHIEEFKTLLEQIASPEVWRRLDQESGVLERRGVHERSARRALEQRPAAQWTPEERVARAHAALLAYEEHLKGRRAVPADRPPGARGIEHAGEL